MLWVKTTDGIEFSGDLDENSDLTKLPEDILAWMQKSDSHAVVVNFEKVERSNSVGLMEWINVLNKLGKPFHYVKTPWWLIQQINMNPDFLSSGSKVVSFLAPFVNMEREDEQVQFLLVVGKDVEIRDDYEGFSLNRVESDGVEFEPDFEPEDYLYFISDYVDNY